MVNSIYDFCGFWFSNPKMYCPACGKEMLSDAKFCPSCGKATGAQGAPTRPEKEEKPKRKGNPTAACLGILLIVIFAPALVVFFGKTSSQSEINSKTLGIITIVVVAIILVAVLYKTLARLVFGSAKALFRLIKYLIKRPKLGVVALVGLLILIIFTRFGLAQLRYNKSIDQLPTVQDSLSEAAAAKIMGDALMAGRSVNSWWGKIAETSSGTADNLSKVSVTSLLNDYKRSAIAWSASVAAAANNTNLWKSLGEQPGDFTISLNNRRLVEYVDNSLKKVAALKEAGDMAIKRGDRQTMYYIAAKLLVQEHWVNGLYYSKNPGFLSLGHLRLVSPALAKFTGFTANVVHRGPRCIVFSPKGAYIPLICPRGREQTPISFSKIVHAAVEYAEAQPGSAEQWSKEWNAEDLQVPFGQGQHIETGGVHVGDDPNLPPELSRTEQAFVDQCKAKGGLVGGGGGVMERLPVVETGGGFRCEYNHNGQKCWDLLTRSYGRYMGGNKGCPELNLLPPPPPPKPTPKPTPTPSPTPSPAPSPTPSPTPTPTPTPAPSPTPQNISWDGTYSLSNNVHCNVPGVFSTGLMPSSNSITVSGNQVVFPGLGSTPIDSSGNAAMTLTVSYGDMGLQAHQTFSFSRSDGGATVRGDISLNGGGSVEGVGFDLNCSGSFSGRRQ